MRRATISNSFNALLSALAAASDSAVALRCAVAAAALAEALDAEPAVPEREAAPPAAAAALALVVRHAAQDLRVEAEEREEGNRGRGVREERAQKSGPEQRSSGLRLREN